ncbi:serine/threonine-protein kinase [Actinopolymorpha alba]|uniref:serine/threonine-protein kinase n=1 Tax=Actinopolymorpha alba TaxID=533267 RepID=UPI00037B515B|nr:serine/threonine-protein kinase [Actinopolymorpha alba]
MSEGDQLIAGRYRLNDRLGSGGMGVVWRAHDERLNREVAVKRLLLPAYLTGSQAEEAKLRAMRESRIAARIQHPNVIAIFDVVEDDGHPCLVMEYLPSKSLSEVLAERGRLSPEEVAHIGAQAATALASAHAAGVVHRDIKPGNVLMADNGTVKIADFGIARAPGDVTVTATGLISGTPAYLSPEVARGQSATFASDIFSLGSTLYTAVEGRPPFGPSDNAIALLYRVASGQFDPPRQAGPLTRLLHDLLNPSPRYRPSAWVAGRALASIAAARLSAARGLSAVPANWQETVTLARPEKPETVVEASPTVMASEPTVVAAAPAEAEVKAEPAEDGAATNEATNEDLPAVTTHAEQGSTDEPASDPKQGNETVVSRDADPIPDPERIPDGEGIPDQEQFADPEQPGHPGQSGEQEQSGDQEQGSRKRLLWLTIGVAAVLVVAGVSLAMAFDRVRTDRNAEPAVSGTPRTSASTHRTTTPSPAPPSRPARTTPAPTSPTASVPTSANPTPSRTPSPRTTAPATSRAQAVSDYYALMPGNLQGGWSRLSPRYQRQAGGFASYRGFWSGMRAVGASNVVARGNRVEATVTYTRRSGSTVRERRVFSLIQQNGRWLIDASSIL